jgi:protein-L-isoaspartate(D-aspartate) O-methyltransferase
MTTTDFQDAGAAPGTARRAMIDSQLRTSGVNEPWVLSAFARVPRENFVPQAARAHAYIDRALPLEDGRLLAPALVHGKMLGAAAPVSADKVLVITSGSLYLAELLNGLAGTVDTVDARNVAVGVSGSGYTLVFVDGAAEQLPPSVAGALAEGGRVITGLVDGAVTRLGLGRKVAGELSFVPLADLAIPVLAEFATPKSWSF